MERDFLSNFLAFLYVHNRNIYKYRARIIIMVYTEIKKNKKNKYFYRVRSIRKGKRFSKKRIYLGANLSKEELAEKEKQADKKLLEEVIYRNIEKIKPKIINILKKYHVKKAGIFGSYAVGEQKKDSDIDILIEPPKNMGFKFVGLEIQLTKALKKKVDLVSYNGISPYLKSKILDQEIRIK